MESMKNQMKYYKLFKNKKIPMINWRKKFKLTFKIIKIYKNNNQKIQKIIKMIKNKILGNSKMKQ